MYQIDNLYHTMFSKYPDVVSTETMAQMLGIGRNRAYDLIHDKSIKCIRVGRNIKISKLHIIEFLLTSTQEVD